MTMFTLSIFSVLGLRDQSLSYEEPVFTLLVGLCKVGKKRTKFILTQMFPSTRPAVSSTPKPAVEQRTAHTLAVPVPISDARSPRTPSCRQLQAARSFPNRGGGRAQTGFSHGARRLRQA